MTSIVNHFAILGEVADITPLGDGLINATYKVTTKGDTPDYVLQHINNAIFTDVDLLMNNIVTATNHLRKKLKTVGVADVNRHCLKFIPLKNEEKYYFVDGEEKYWRVMEFIPDTISKSGVSLESAYIVGETFGDFQANLADINTELGETIKDFHNIEFRLQQLDDAIAADPKGRVAEVKNILDIIANRRDTMSRSERLYREGKLPKRICHCDTKVDNILFDKDGSVLCVIDLDTVMPSFIFSDYGDFLRSAANFVKEDDPAIDKVGFNIEVFKAFTKGYLKTASAFLTPIEIENLPYAAMLFPYMQLVRFLADYINGDTYFRIQYPEHNLVRSKNQLALFLSAESQLSSMESFIQEQMK